MQCNHMHLNTRGQHTFLVSTVTRCATLQLYKSLRLV